jgi:hypothetical protein
VRSVPGVLLLLIAPVLLGAPADASAATALVALALATAVLVIGAHRGLSAYSQAVTVWPTAEAVVPASSGLVTDPVHHPIRPRAPGVA